MRLLCHIRKQEGHHYERYSLKLGAFVKASGKPFVAIVLGDDAIDIKAAQTDNFGDAARATASRAGIASAGRSTTSAARSLDRAEIERAMDEFEARPWTS